MNGYSEQYYKGEIKRLENDIKERNNRIEKLKKKVNEWMEISKSNSISIGFTLTMQKSLMTFLDEVDKLENKTTEHKLYMVYALEDELHEYTKNINWKPWKKTKIEENRDEIAKELMDAFLFFNQLWLLEGFDEKDFEKYYNLTMQKAFARIESNY